MSSPQRVHAAVLASFPPGGAYDHGRVLWRLDQPDAGRLDLFVASPRRPDFTHLAEQAGWPTQPTWETADYEPFLGRLRPGQCWVFRLTANPVRSVRDSTGGRGRPISVGSPVRQEAWLLQRAEGWGFRVPPGESDRPNLRVSDRTNLSFTKRDGDESRSVTVARAQFDGLMEVVDPDALRGALVGGVGRARAYGCGLLTLAPVP